MRRLLLAAITATSLACATQPAPAPAPAPVAAAATPPCVPGHAIVNAVLWVQSSAEYRAATLGTYANARRMLDLALADPAWSAFQDQTAASSLPPAVILDVDETAALNTPFEARVAKMGKTYDQKVWDQWVLESAQLEVPGAGDFLRYAKSRGVTPFYISNRKAAEEAPTRAGLAKLNYPLDPNEDTVLFRGERPEWDSGDKSPRRAHVAAHHRVLLVLGDDLNDFVPARDKTKAERDEIINDASALWGTKWLMIPNPMYGSWERASAGDGSDCAQFERKLEALRP